MKRLNEKKLLRLIRSEYENRLVEVAINAKLKETEMYDKRGNQLLSQGLKVKHKKSGYEYTVDHIEGEGDSAIVFLRHPETPRFEKPDSQATLHEAEVSVKDGQVNYDDLDYKKISGDRFQKPVSLEKTDEPKSLISVTKVEFEKEYEVD